MAWLETDWVNVTAADTVYTGDDLDEMAQTDPDRFNALQSHEERRWVPVTAVRTPRPTTSGPTSRSSAKAAQMGRGRATKRRRGRPRASSGGG